MANQDLLIHVAHASPYVIQSIRVNPQQIVSLGNAEGRHAAKASGSQVIQSMKNAQRKAREDK